MFETISLGIVSTKVIQKQPEVITASPYFCAARPLSFREVILKITKILILKPSKIKSTFHENSIKILYLELYSIPWSNVYPAIYTDWRRKRLPTPVFLPGKPHGQRSLMGYSPGSCKDLTVCMWLSTYIHTGFGFIPRDSRLIDTTPLQIQLSFYT